MCVVVSAAVALWSCGQAPVQNILDQQLSAYDFTDSLVAAKIISQLPEADRDEFQDWLLHHYALADGFCGDVLVDENGVEARTIGEAIALTRVRAFQLASAKRGDDLDRLHPQERRARQIDDLVERRLFLLDQLSIELMMPEPNTEVRQKNMRAQIAEVDAALRVFGIEPDEIT